MIGVPTSLVTIGKDLGHLKEARNVDTNTVQASMIIGEQMTDISLVDRDQGKLPPRLKCCQMAESIYCSFEISRDFVFIKGPRRPWRIRPKQPQAWGWLSSWTKKVFRAPQEGQKTQVRPYFCKIEISNLTDFQSCFLDADIVYNQF